MTSFLKCSEYELKNMAGDRRQKRADVFVKLVRFLDKGNLETKTADKISDFVELNLSWMDYEYMSFKDLCLLRSYELIELPEFYELYPEEFLIEYGDREEEEEGY